MTVPHFVRLGHRVARPMLLLAPLGAGAAYYFQIDNVHDAQNALHRRARDLPHFLSARVGRAVELLQSFAEAKPAVFSALDRHQAGQYNEKLPTLSGSQVRATRHNKAPQPIYVTFRDGVYDISEFSEGHPGGDQILLAAGGPLEMYWVMYPQHAKGYVLDMLEEMRVANLDRDAEWNRLYDRNGLKKGEDGKRKKAHTAYDTDPIRHPAMIVQTSAPYTAEPPASVLVSSHHTPNELFYVRNHFPVPKINEDDYRLSVIGAEGKENVVNLSMKDLRTKFRTVSVDATVQCAGNRRNELGRVRKVKGGGWELGAISNAEWTGVRLVDVLTHAVGEGDARRIVNDEAYGGHVCFEGLDEDPVTGVRYSASIPMDVLRRHGDHVILAYEMNGKQLPRDHGYPLRVVVPGVVGARHVKWVGKIWVSRDESNSHWQRRDYRSFAPDVNWDKVDFSAAPSIHEMPVVSAICAHRVVDGEVRVEGYAWSGDGKEIIRVDVSADGGESWTAAQLQQDDKDMNRKRNQVYDWTLWKASLPVANGDGKGVQLVCKAVDSSYNTQPDGAANVWNLRGLLNNSWHRVDVDEAINKEDKRSN